MAASIADDMEAKLSAAGVKDPAAVEEVLAEEDIDWDLLTSTFARGGEAVTALLQNTLLNSAYEWACPECVKKGVEMHKRKQVTPATAMAAGQKRKRGRGRN